MTTDNIQIADNDLPALHNAASSASVKAQKYYLAFFLATLLLMIVGSAVSAVSVSAPNYKSLKGLVVGIVFGLGLIITSTLKAKKFEKDWYGGRAIAESTKTVAWRYMMKADPFASDLQEREADETFTAGLKSLLDQRKYLSGALDARLSTKPQITNRMRAIRSLDTSERKGVYLEQRIQQQQQWYSSKASQNRKKESAWFVVIMLAQAAALASAFFLVYSPESKLNLTGLCATAATAAIAWLQVKRHQELSQSYTLTTQELGLVATKARHIKTDDELSTFVGDAENAISREHTMWIARRDQV